MPRPMKALENPNMAIRASEKRNTSYEMLAVGIAVVDDSFHCVQPFEMLLKWQIGHCGLKIGGGWHWCQTGHGSR